MIKEKRLLISEHCVESNEFVEEITKKLELFVDTYMFESKSEIEFKIEPWYIDNPEWNVNACIEIKFNEYEYSNEKITDKESILLVLEDKGIQAFYIDGKFEKRIVYEWIQECPIQKNDSIYGYDKHLLSRMFNDFVLTC